MNKLTNRQQQVLDFIKSQISQTGMPPTRSEIALELGFKSANAAEEHLKALQKKGVIEILPGISRGLKLIEDINEEHKGLPLIGFVAAGEPILAEQNIEDFYNIPENFFNPKADFLLRVKGESMINIGILNNDILAVHNTNIAINGQIVVARVENEVTVKRYEKKDNTVYLYSENELFSTFVIDLTMQQFCIEGIAVGIIRTSFKI